MDIKEVLNKKAATHSLLGLQKMHPLETAGVKANTGYSLDSAISDLQTIFSDPDSTQDEKQMAKHLINSYTAIHWQIIKSLKINT